MKTDLMELLNALHGKLHGNAKFYFRRMPSGRIYASRCPNRSNHVKTPGEAANQQRFAARYAGKHNKQ